jgi:hypothetical protein
MQRFNAAEQALIDVWEAHTAAEFEHQDADEAIATMTEHPVLIHVPNRRHRAGSTTQVLQGNLHSADATRC